MKLKFENTLSQEKIKEFCKKYNIKKISLFGSGEAANGISSEFQNNYSSIPWKALMGMRNRLIHGYDIDLDVVWKTVSKDLPKLKKS